MNFSMSRFAFWKIQFYLNFYLNIYATALDELYLYIFVYLVIGLNLDKGINRLQTSTFYNYLIDHAF